MNHLQKLGGLRLFVQARRFEGALVILTFGYLRCARSPPDGCSGSKLAKSRILGGDLKTTVLWAKVGQCMGTSGRRLATSGVLGQLYNNLRERGPPDVSFSLGASLKHFV